VTDFGLGTPDNWKVIASLSFSSARILAATSAVPAISLIRNGVLELATVNVSAETFREMRFHLYR
jgi:hypothetical protein